MQYTSNEQAVLGENNEVVTKMENGVNVITKDGKEVARGNKIFIPWGKDDDTEGKIIITMAMEERVHGHFRIRGKMHRRLRYTSFLKMEKAINKQCL